MGFQMECSRKQGPLRRLCQEDGGGEGSQASELLSQAPCPVPSPLDPTQALSDLLPPCDSWGGWASPWLLPSAISVWH